MILAPLLVWLFLIVGFALAFIVRRYESFGDGRFGRHTDAVPDAERHHEQS